MCGGYYEEEFEMQGPAVQFKSEAGFHQAIGVCMKHLLSEEWVMDENLLKNYLCNTKCGAEVHNNLNGVTE